MINKSLPANRLSPTRLLVFQLLILCLNIATVAYAKDTNIGIEWYEKGKQAFAEKQYTEAIDYYKKAFEQGYDAARLHHAWGAALYQAQQYIEAEQHFQKALKDPEFTQLAYLNLGLVALKQNQNDQAIAWFLKARDNGDSDKVRILAEEMLLRMNYRVEESFSPKATTIYFLMKAGYEDQSYSIALDEIGGSDRFLQLNLYGSTRVSGGEIQGLNANLNAFTLQNQESQSTEVSLVAMEVEYYKNQRQWRVNSKLGVTPSYVGGEPYTTEISADFAFRYRLRKSTILGGRLRYESVNAEAAEVDYAAGKVLKSRVQLKHSVEKNLYYAYYQYEHHDLNDRILGSNFYSYSPTRHIIQLQHRYQLANAWSLKTKLRYRHSEYADPNQINGVTKLRVEDQVKIDFNIGYLFNRNTTLLFGLEHTDNNSSWDQYTYKRNEYTLGVEWFFL